MQVSLIEGLCLQFGAASLFFTIACDKSCKVACDLLNIVCCRPRAYAEKPWICVRGKSHRAVVASNVASTIQQQGSSRG